MTHGPAFSDHFSAMAERYAKYRPVYPAALFDWLAECAPACDRAWDCGTGSGQAALPLAERFTEVIATDPSAAQLSTAIAKPNIHYAVMTGEASALCSQSFSVVTVAQALHWFKLDQFYHEVRRVVRPGGVVAVWTYALFHLGDSAIDDRIHRFYTRDVGPWWPAERKIVDAGYSSLPFPFKEKAVPRFSMQADWTLSQFAGYLSTWSAVTRYQKDKQVDPVAPFIEELTPLWGDPDSRRRVEWPLEVRAGVV